MILIKTLLDNCLIGSSSLHVLSHIGKTIQDKTLKILSETSNPRALILSAKFGQIMALHGAKNGLREEAMVDYT